MLCLMFHAGCNRYSLPVSDVVEVLPYMTLQRWPESPPSVAGMFVYRGQATAVIDLQHLAGQGPTVPQWNTRVLILRRSQESVDRGISVTDEVVGLLVGRVSTYERKAVSAEVGEVAGAWGTYDQDQQGLFQSLNVERLIASALSSPAHAVEVPVGAPVSTRAQGSTGGAEQ